MREDYPEVFAEIAEVERHSWVVRKDRPGAKKMLLKGERFFDGEVENWGRSRLVLKAQYNAGNLDDAFLAKLARVDRAFLRRDGKWGGTATLTPDTLPAPLKRGLIELLMSKGYERSCAFGET